MSRAIEERREKIISIDQRELIRVFNILRDKPNRMKLVNIEGLPDDAEVVRVYPNHARMMAIDVVVASEEFEPVDFGAELPRHDGGLHKIEWVDLLQYVDENSNELALHRIVDLESMVLSLKKQIKELHQQKLFDEASKKILESIEDKQNSPVFQLFNGGIDQQKQQRQEEASK